MRSACLPRHPAVAWGLGIVNTVAIERRHPELILPSTWTYIKVRYKPWQLSQKEYQITLGEFVRGQIELIVYGAPVGLLVGGWACGNIMAARKMAGVSDCFWGVDCSHGRRHRLCDSKAIARRAHALNGTTRKLSGRIDYRRILVAAKDLTDR